MTREASLRRRLSEGEPDVVVDLHLYSEADGGKTVPVALGWGCPCTKNTGRAEGWDGFPLLESDMMPGERRRVGFVFMSGREAVEALASPEPFYLWESRIIGEATIVR